MRVRGGEGGGDGKMGGRGRRRVGGGVGGGLPCLWVWADGETNSKLGGSARPSVCGVRDVKVSWLCICSYSLWLGVSVCIISSRQHLMSSPCSPLRHHHPPLPFIHVTLPCHVTIPFNLASPNPPELAVSVASEHRTGVVVDGAATWTFLLGYIAVTNRGKGSVMAERERE